jgi:hypothetical protein
MPRTLTQNKLDAVKNALKTAASMVDVAQTTRLSLATCYKIAQNFDLPTPFRKHRDLALGIGGRNKLVEDIINGSIYAAARMIGVKPSDVQAYIQKHYARKIVALGLPVPNGHRDYRIALYLLNNPDKLSTDADTIAKTLNYHPSIVRRYFER